MQLASLPLEIKMWLDGCLGFELRTGHRLLHSRGGDGALPEGLRERGKPVMSLCVGVCVCLCVRVRSKEGRVFHTNDAANYKIT